MSAKIFFLSKHSDQQQGAEKEPRRPIRRLLGAVTGISDVAAVARRATGAAASDVRQAHSVTSELVGEISRWTNPPNRRTETYEAAVARHHLTKGSLAQRLTSCRMHARLATVIAWLFLSAAAGAAIGGQPLWVINGAAGAVIFVGVALESWFDVVRIERREFFSAAEFFRRDALKCLNVLTWR